MNEIKFIIFLISINFRSDTIINPPPEPETAPITSLNSIATLHFNRSCIFKFILLKKLLLLIFLEF